MAIYLTTSYTLTKTHSVCNNNSDSLGSLNGPPQPIDGPVNTTSPCQGNVDEVEEEDEDEEEEYDEGYTYEEQENGSSVDIETEADDDECGLIEGKQPFQRADVDPCWSNAMTSHSEPPAQDQWSWHYNERAYEDLCYVTFSSEVNIYRQCSRDITRCFYRLYLRS